MRKTGFILLAAVISLVLFPYKTLAAGGIYASGGGTKTVGQTFTVSVAASGADFNYLEGKISVSGPVSIVSFSAGNADTWITRPDNNATFYGAFLGKTVNSFTVATIKLKGTAPGSGAVTVSNVSLKNAGSSVGSGASSAGFTIQKAPDLPGSISVSSTTHPDPAQSYEATAISLSWTKASNVTGFSYVLDQTADTTPPSKATDANTSASYDNKAVGTYYFHIKGQSADGWGPVTHFKINIKEPDPKINDQLSKPSEFKFEKLTDYINDIAAGTFAGFKISGKTEPNFSANLKLDPVLSLPEGKTLTAKADENGLFEFLVDFPIKAGRYTLTVQGQNEKILTPISDPVYFEISQVKGGRINILTADDTKEPVSATASETTPKWYQRINYKALSAILGGILVITIGLFVFYIIRRKQFERLIRNIK